MESSATWAEHAEEWLARDLALLTEQAGWRAVKATEGIEIWSRSMPDDPNDLFRWRLATVDAPAEVVFEHFVHRILEHHQEWTKEFAGGHVVEEPAPGARILYQRFDPGIPGVAKRDLCSVEVVREFGPGERLVSYRSVDRLLAEPGRERIDWWGAALCRTHADGRTSELLYLDRENQGGLFPSWLMNWMMPGYLLLQAREVRRFFRGVG